MLEGHGTRVPATGEVLERYGLRGPAALHVQVFDDEGPVVTARFGRVAPGARGQECYLHAPARERSVLHWSPNPWSSLGQDLAGGVDPARPFLLDRRVIPVALGRGLPTRIGFSGAADIRVTEIFSERIEMSPDESRSRPAGPRIEWYGRFPGIDRQRLADGPAREYARFLLELTFAELLGSRDPHREAFENPWFVITLEYEGGEEDRLEVAHRTPEGHYRLANVTTNQAVRLEARHVTRLLPDPAALRP